MESCLIVISRSNYLVISQLRNKRTRVKKLVFYFNCLYAGIEGETEIETEIAIETVTETGTEDDVTMIAGVTDTTTEIEAEIPVEKIGPQVL